MKTENEGKKREQTKAEIILVSCYRTCLNLFLNPVERFTVDK